MKRLLGRRRVVVGLGLLAAPVVAASIAYACSALATLSLNPGAANPGATVSASGRGFSSTHGGAAAAEPVVVRIGSNGPTVWSGRPDPSGNVNMSFQIPANMPAGSYTIVASQNNSDGQPVPGTPARAELTVNAQPAVTGAAPSPAAPQGFATPAPQGASSVAPTAAPAGVPAVAGSASAAPGTEVAPGATVTPGVPGTPGAAPAIAPVPAVGADRSASAANSVAPRSAMVGTSSGSPALPLGLVGAGLVLTLAATASVIAGRKREAKALGLRR